MTRLELLHLVIARARANGFEFRRWYTAKLALPWISYEAALNLLDAQKRYYALIFSHEFAQHFWKAGSEITFDVPAQSFQRAMPDGSTRTIERKGFIRRSARPNAWRYHLREMTLAEEPLRYLRKYLHIEEDPAAEELFGREITRPARESNAPTRKAPVPIRSGVAGLPPFLQRPYQASPVALPISGKSRLKQ